VPHAKAESGKTSLQSEGGANLEQCTGRLWRRPAGGSPCLYLPTKFPPLGTTLPLH
jgi:hypothetical protein